MGARHVQLAYKETVPEVLYDVCESIESESNNYLELQYADAPTSDGWQKTAVAWVSIRFQQLIEMDFGVRVGQLSLQGETALVEVEKMPNGVATPLKYRARSGEFEQWARVLEPYRVDRFGVSEGLHIDYVECLARAKREEDLQEFLGKWPESLVQHMPHGQGRWVISKQRLGSQFVTDFLVAGRDSIGFHWTAVELQHPNHRAFLEDGQPNEHTREGLAQIRTWRRWISENLSYARQLDLTIGLGLPGIDQYLPGLVFVGRDKDFTEVSIPERRRLYYEDRIEVRSFDWLARCIEERVFRFRPRADDRDEPEQSTS